MFAEDDEGTSSVCPGLFLDLAASLVVCGTTEGGCTAAPSMGGQGGRTRGKTGLTGVVVAWTGAASPHLLVFGEGSADATWTSC